MAITKANIRDFLSEKQKEIKKAKLVPLREERDAIKDQVRRNALGEIESNSTWDMADFIAKFSELAKEAATIRDDTGTMWGILRDVGNKSDMTLEQIADDILYDFSCGHSNNWEYPVRVNELETEIQDLEIRIRDQFRKLEALVLSNSAKQCITLLKEAGFDTDDLENRFATPKNEVKALDIDNDLLDLPEQKKAENNG